MLPPVTIYTQPHKFKWPLWICMGLAVYCLLFFLHYSQYADDYTRYQLGHAFTGFLAFSLMTCFYLYLLLQKPYKKLSVDEKGIYVFKQKNSVYAFFPWYAVKSIPTHHYILHYQHLRVFKFSLSLDFWETRKALDEQRDENSRNFFQSCTRNGTSFTISTDELEISPEKLWQIINKYLQQYREQHPQ